MTAIMKPCLMMLEHDVFVKAWLVHPTKNTANRFSGVFLCELKCELKRRLKHELKSECLNLNTIHKIIHHPIDFGFD